MSILILASISGTDVFSTLQEFPTIMDKGARGGEKVTNQGDYWINQEYSFSP